MEHPLNTTFIFPETFFTPGGSMKIGRKLGALVGRLLVGTKAARRKRTGRGSKVLQKIEGKGKKRRR